MSDFQNDLRNYVESVASPVSADEVMGSYTVSRRVPPSTRRGLVVALATAAAVLAAVVGASYFINQAPDQVVPIGTTATTVSSNTTITNSTVATTTSVPSSTTSPVAAAVAVSALFDGEGPRDALVSGFFLWDVTGVRLCELLLESFPPQCGGAWLVIADPENLDAVLDNLPTLSASDGVSWTDTTVEIAAYFDGNRLILGGPGSADPSEQDLALAEAFVDFAAGPNPDTAAQVPFGESVEIGLGPDALKVLSGDDLADPSAWVFDTEFFRAYTGPFTALTLVKEPFTVTIGTHPHCASPPVAPPSGFETYRRVSLQPETATSCLEWWTVDLFVDADGTIGAVTMDLYEP